MKYTLETTKQYDKWFRKLKDSLIRIKIPARAMGMSEVAKKAGVTRASLYKSLSENGNPGFVTISKVTKALGCKLAVA